MKCWEVLLERELRARFGDQEVLSEKDIRARFGGTVCVAQVVTVPCLKTAAFPLQQCRLIETEAAFKRCVLLLRTGSPCARCVIVFVVHSQLRTGSRFHCVPCLLCVVN